MKLLRKTSFYFLGFSTLILFVGGIGIYFVLNYALNHEMDESLQHTRSVLFEELNQKDSLPTTIEIMDEIIDLTEVSSMNAKEVFKDTLREMLDDGELELEPFRKYVYTEKIKGKYYRIELHHSKFEREHLLVAITGLIIGSLLFFLILLNVFNRYLSKRLWSPFYHTIQQIRSFSLMQPKEIASLPNNIEEFQILDRSLKEMTSKLIYDFQSLKKFSENASHEIQTPLAIIQSQLDLILQDQKLSESALGHLQHIQQSTAKLAKINQALLLLTKIGNRQFSEVEAIELTQVINKELDGLSILLEAKAILVSKDISSTVITANPVLVETLVSNIFSNAIKHNLVEGQINIELSKHQLSVSNTGPEITKSPIKLFERFQKADEATKSVGLGLAIVKEICDTYGWEVDYQFVEQWHYIFIHFK